MKNFKKVIATIIITFFVFCFLIVAVPLMLASTGANVPTIFDWFGNDTISFIIENCDFLLCLAPIFAMLSIFLILGAMEVLDADE